MKPSYEFLDGATYISGRQETFGQAAVAAALTFTALALLLGFAIYAQ